MIQRGTGVHALADPSPLQAGSGRDALKRCRIINRLAVRFGSFIRNDERGAVGPKRQSFNGQRSFVRLPSVLPRVPVDYLPGCRAAHAGRVVLFVHPEALRHSVKRRLPLTVTEVLETDGCSLQIASLRVHAPLTDIRQGGDSDSGCRGNS
jgi:hypothetical protein